MVHLTTYSSPNRHAIPQHFGAFILFLLTTLNHNHKRNKEKTVMSFYAHLLKPPNRRVGAFGVFHASQTQKSQLPLASKTNKLTSL